MEWKYEDVGGEKHNVCDTQTWEEVVEQILHGSKARKMNLLMIKDWIIILMPERENSEADGVSHKSQDGEYWGQYAANYPSGIIGWNDMPLLHHWHCHLYWSIDTQSSSDNSTPHSKLKFQSRLLFSSSKPKGCDFVSICEIKLYCNKHCEVLVSCSGQKIQKDSKRNTQEPSETFRNLQETSRNCMQATVTACKLL